jgi:medium-chain acyl-[acyl-carrier-protein] hydrolase
MESLQFEKEYRIHVYETGPDGKLNLYSLFNYMQDIAADHATRLGFGRDDLMKDNRFWVLSRMYSEVAMWPSWKDEIIIKTWPNGTDKLFALRNYEAKYPDGRHIASGSSSWLMLDRNSKKVQRPDPILSRYYEKLIPGESPIRYASKLEPASENGKLTPVYRIRISDLDENHHTNNVRYLKWVFDTYSLEFVMNNVLQSAEINYLAESLYNEEIIIRTSVLNDNSSDFIHSVFRTSDNKELCRIRLIWKDGKIK